MTEYSIEELIAWCDKKDTDGHSLGIKWSGGGGGGGIEFFVDDQESTEPQANKLTDMMSGEIGYGWWYVNGLISGEVKYNPEAKLFKGEYSTIDNDFSEEVDLICHIPLRIPKSKKFKEVTISQVDEEIFFTLYSDSNEIIKENKVLKEIKENLEKELFKEIYDQFPDTFRLGYSEEITIGRDEFSEEGNDLLYYIDRLTIDIIKYNCKDVSLNLRKILKKSKNSEK